MDALAADEIEVLRLRFSEEQRLCTHAEVARAMAVPVKQVRQIEFRALRKLRATALGPITEGFEGWDEV